MESPPNDPRVLQSEPDGQEPETLRASNWRKPSFKNAIQAQLRVTGMGRKQRRLQAAQIAKGKK